ncbi:MAG: hypothetical protein JOS17DRAFT_816050, partial [Linnemannia elongata]
MNMEWDRGTRQVCGKKKKTVHKRPFLQGQPSQSTNSSSSLPTPSTPSTKPSTFQGHQQHNNAYHFWSCCPSPCRWSQCPDRKHQQGWKQLASP